MLNIINRDINLTWDQSWLTTTAPEEQVKEEDLKCSKTSTSTKSTTLIKTSNNNKTSLVIYPFNSKKWNFSLVQPFQC